MSLETSDFYRKSCIEMSHFVDKKRFFLFVLPKYSRSNGVPKRSHGNLATDGMIILTMLKGLYVVKK